MRLIYRHFPLTGIHDKASLSAVAAEAAGAQGSFWEYHIMLYETQGDWSRLSVAEARQKFIDYAGELNLDVDQFETDLDSSAYQDVVDAAELAAQMAGLSGTPTVLVNGYLFPTQQIPLTPDGVRFFLDIVKLLETQYNAPQQVIDPEKDYQATITTEAGDIVIDLYTDTAPVNVNSVAFLAQQGWYNGVTFHRVLPDFMAQGGDPSGVGIGWPGYRCNDEISSGRTFDKAGIVAMANSGADTNGAQFFITFGPAPHLDGGYTIIGEVASGQEIVDGLTPRDPEQNPDFTGDKIVSLTVTEK